MGESILPGARFVKARGLPVAPSRCIRSTSWRVPDVFPVDEALPRLRAALAGRRAAVLTAPPGAGKTTRVPPALLETFPAGGRIVMLEPRRLAAVAAARWMARALGEEVGATVGYAIRFERRVSPATRIEVVTEGILARRLQEDPALEGIACVIFDEFHERSLNADLALALCLDARRTLREDLALLVMSATLDAAPVAALLGGRAGDRRGGEELPRRGPLPRRRAGGAPGVSGWPRRSRAPSRRPGGTSWRSCRARGRSAPAATCCEASPAVRRAARSRCTRCTPTCPSRSRSGRSSPVRGARSCSRRRSPRRA